jgi:hypothetical protein
LFLRKNESLKIQVVYTRCLRRRYDVCGVDFDRHNSRWTMVEECDEYPCDPVDGLFVAKQCLGPNICWY